MGSCNYLHEQSQDNKECSPIISEWAYRICIYSYGIPVLVLKCKAQGFCGFQNWILENDDRNVAGDCGSVRIWNIVY